MIKVNISRLAEVPCFMTRHIRFRSVRL